MSIWQRPRRPPDAFPVPLKIWLFGRALCSCPRLTGELFHSLLTPGRATPEKQKVKKNSSVGETEWCSTHTHTHLSSSMSSVKWEGGGVFFPEESSKLV